MGSNANQQLRGSSSIFQAPMKRHLRSPKPATVDSWLTKWGGDRGANSGAGRDGYLHMRVVLRELQPTQRQLTQILQTLAEYVRPRKSK